jgi:cytosine/adenosine deaminase-related metal-dependent hydrolase
MGLWDGSFPVPGTGAVAAWTRSGLLDGRALLVHGVHLEPADLAAIASSGATLCLCPRSNAYLDLPPAPVTAMVEAGIPLALGTDSKASNQDLGIWGEMRAIRNLMPAFPAAAILQAATVNGARGLGLDHRVGAIRPGLIPRLVRVAFSGPVPEDPHEFLVREPVEADLQTGF